MIRPAYCPCATTHYLGIWNTFMRVGIMKFCARPPERAIPFRRGQGYINFLVCMRISTSKQRNCFRWPIYLFVMFYCVMYSLYVIDVKQIKQIYQYSIAKSWLTDLLINSLTGENAQPKPLAVKTWNLKGVFVLVWRGVLKRIFIN